jgi:hypothetical protein
MDLVARTHACAGTTNHKTSEETTLALRRDGTGAPAGFEYCKDMINDRNVLVGSATCCPAVCPCMHAMVRSAKQPDFSAGHTGGQDPDIGEPRCI